MAVLEVALRNSLGQFYDKIIVDEKQMTNVPGLFAAGDCTPGIMQIAKAVGDGCVAGLESIAFVRQNK